MIQAVIFDCFGVLVRDGWLPFCEKHFSDNPECMRRAHEINHQTDKGMMSYSDYITELSELTGMSSDVVAKEIAHNPRNSEIFAIIRQLKSEFKIGLLSNAAANWLDELIGAENAALFDETVLSCDIGALKPDPRTYEAISDRLGVSPKECIFIDDQPHFCEGAKAYGMQAIIYKDNPQLINSFKNYNIFV